MFAVDRIASVPASARGCNIRPAVASRPLSVGVADWCWRHMRV